MAGSVYFVVRPHALAYVTSLLAAAFRSNLCLSTRLMNDWLDSVLEKGFHHLRYRRRCIKPSYLREAGIANAFGSASM